jgi:TatD DNase family protein
LIDVHCHIDIYPDPVRMALESEKNQIATVAVTNLPSHFEMGYNHLVRFKKVYLALGMHPLLASRHQQELPLYKKLLHKTKFIGEIGLDFSREGIATKEAQIRSLRFIFDLLRHNQKFISLHSRGSESAILELLEEYRIKEAVLHWYSGSKTNLERAIEFGSYFSVNPAMVVSQKGQKIIEAVPMERILTETDGPYLKVNAKPATPTDVKLILRYLSNIWEMSVEESEVQVEENFNYVMGKILR